MPIFGWELFPLTLKLRSFQIVDDKNSSNVARFLRSTKAAIWLANEDEMIVYYFEVGWKHFIWCKVQERVIPREDGFPGSTRVGLGRFVPSAWSILRYVKKTSEKFLHSCVKRPRENGEIDTKHALQPTPTSSEAS